MRLGLGLGLDEVAHRAEGRVLQRTIHAACQGVGVPFDEQPAARPLETDGGERLLRVRVRVRARVRVRVRVRVS